MFLPYLAGPDDGAAASLLIELFGDDAGWQAAARADKSRHIGNHLHFCRWRPVERLIVLLSIDRCRTIH